MWLVHQGQECECNSLIISRKNAMHKTKHVAFGNWKMTTSFIHVVFICKYADQRPIESALLG